MIIPFYQCNSNGNDFKIILNKNSIDYSLFTKEKIKNICRKEEGSSVDGLILLNYKNDSIYMDYYNNDGTWETFCLNGVICASLILKKEFDKNCFDIISNKILYITKNLGDDFVKVKINKPNYKKKNINIDGLIGNYFDSGAKHLVINYMQDWDSEKQLFKKMQKLRYNKLFSPSGLNVNFYKELKQGTIHVKTYEKGIEAIMDSCASGSYACAYDYSKNNNNIKSVNIINDGGSSKVLFGRDYSSNFFSSKGFIDKIGNVKV